MFAGPQDVLTGIFGLLDFVVEPSRRLWLALLAYAVVPLPVAFLLRRWALQHSFRLGAVRRGLRRIWVTQRRRPRAAADSALRLMEETDANPLTAVLCWVAATGLMVWWWAAAVTGWDDPAFREAFGQRRPVMYGVPLSPQIRWEVDTDRRVLAVLLLTFVLTPVLLGWRARMVARRVARRRGREVGPWHADVRFVLGLCAAVIGLTVTDLMLWQRVAVAVALLAEVGLTALVVRTTRLTFPMMPLWVDALIPAAARPRRGLGERFRGFRQARAARSAARRQRRPAALPRTTVADPGSPSGPTALMGTGPRSFLSGADAVTESLPSLAGKELAGETGRRAAESWAAYAPRLAPLKDRDRRRIGPYTLLGRLGVGGMSVVYAGRHRREGRDVAVKVLRDLADDPAGQSRLLHEMEALASATGPHTVGIFHVGHDGDDHFLVMERLFGPNLWDFVHRLGPIQHPEALTHLAGVLAAGLADFHTRGVTHRDLKPANVMLTDRGPVIVDLGIAKLADATATLPGGHGFATLGYVAPETILGRGTFATADVWSWGCCLAYAASGQRLFPGEEWDATTYAILNGRRNPAAMQALRQTSPALADLVWQATETDPGQRPVNGGALLERLPPGARWLAPGAALRAPAAAAAETTVAAATVLRTR